MPTDEQVVIELDEYEIVIDEHLAVEVVEQTTIAVNEEIGVEIIEVGEPGNAGPAGENADATFEWATQTFDLAEPQQEFVLNFAPRAGSVFVYLNGLLERFWSVTGSTVTLEDSALEGDSVMVRYQKET